MAPSTFTLVLLVLASTASPSSQQAGAECSTFNNKPGRCTRLPECEVPFTEMAELSRVPCPFTSFERGVCCPLVSIIGGGVDMNAACPPNDGPVTTEFLDHVCQKCEMGRDQRILFETDLLKRGLVPKPNTPSHAHSRMFPTRRSTLDIMRLSEVNLDVTNHLASSFRSCFNSSKEKIDQMVEGLPGMETTRRRGQCPQEPVCSGGLQKYRTRDGSCNNPSNPGWGQADQPFLRLLQPIYGDDVQQFRLAVSSTPEKPVELPNVRFVSKETVVTSATAKYDDFTILLMQWGQFLDHDITHTPNSRMDDNSPIECCDGSKQRTDKLHDRCSPIEIPASDPVYGPLGATCMNFVRSATRGGCRFPRRREQFSDITAYIDASNVYGSSKEEEDRLRSFFEGKMVTNSVRSHLLPEDPNSGENCPRQSKETPCFQAGDGRVNEQTNLVVIHTVWVQYHNLLASGLKLLNSHWDDNTLYQETRRIIGALMQHITYAEYLPIVLGETTMKEYGLLPLPATSDQYRDTYDPNTDATISNVFATAAFRYGHTLIDTKVTGLSRFNTNVLNKNLSDVQFNVNPIYEEGAILNQLRGLTSLTSPKFDNIFSPEIVHNLFRTAGQVGMDLIAINLQRGRDHGLPGYTKWREHCGKGAARGFQDLADVMHITTTQLLQRVGYEHVDDIDVFIGSILESPFRDSLVGHTLVCLLREQFVRLQRGDRFYYENSGLPNSFSRAQLQEIRRSSLSQMICAVAQAQDLQLQANAFMVASAQNQRRPCDSFHKFNLEAWKE